MSTPDDYVTVLNQRGIKLWVENGQLRYHAKKGALTPEELTQLRSMKGEIIKQLTEAASSEAGDLSGHNTVDDIHVPLSFQQLCLLKMLKMCPDWRATLSYTFHLKGTLNLKAVEKSIQELLRRHDSLCASTVCVRGEMMQQILPPDAFRIPITLASGDSATEKEHSAQQLLKSIRTRELDWSVAPSMTAQLIRVAEQEHFLVLLIHRLATDCLGVAQALRDLWDLYAKNAQFSSLTTLEESTLYRDYALWQQATDTTWRQRHATYWNDYLAGAKPISWPPMECAPSKTQDMPGKLTSFESSFGATLSAALKELSRQTQTLTALIVLSLYVACLSLWCGQSDLLLPFIVAGRAASHEGVVGCFSQIAYLRIRLKGEENFDQLLKLVSNEFYRAVAFRQDCGRMAADRPELLRGTLCQWLSWHPADIAWLEAEEHQNTPGLKVEQVRCQTLEELTNAPPELVGLEVNFFEAAGQIAALAIYRTDRFSDSALERLMLQLHTAAEHAVRDPRTPISLYSKTADPESTTGRGTGRLEIAE